MKYSIQKLISVCIFTMYINCIDCQVYNFPVKPGSIEWKKLENNKAKVNVCQLPNELLKKNTTEHLLDICLRYPLINDIYAFNNLNEGVNKLFSDFNGIRELFSRYDIAEKLIIHYNKKLDEKSILNKDTTELSKGEYIISLSTLEILLCRPELQNHISKDKQKDILKNLLKGYESKKVFHIYFQGLGFRTNLLARANIILILDPEELKDIDMRDKESLFLSNKINKNLIEIIDNISYQYIK